MEAAIDKATRLMRPRISDTYFYAARAQGHGISDEAVSHVAHAAARLMYGVLEGAAALERQNGAGAVATITPEALQRYLEHEPEAAGVAGDNARLNTVAVQPWVPDSLFAACLERNADYDTERCLAGKKQKKSV